MQKQKVVFIVMGLLIAGPIAQANPSINIISQEYSATGGHEVWEWCTYCDPEIDIYYEESYYDVSSSYAYGSLDQWEMSSAEGGDVASVNGVVTGVNLFAYAYSFHSGSGLSGGAHIAYASASADLVFQPNHEILNISVESHGWAEANFNLVDLTTNSTVYSGQAEYLFDDWQLITSPTHLYSLSISGNVGLSVFFEGPGGLSVTLDSVPAPGAFFLSTIGVGFLHWLRRRRVM